MKSTASAASSVARIEPLRGESAGVFRRFAAFLYDAVMLCGLLFVATAILLPFNAGAAFRPGQPLYSSFLAAIVFVYFGWFWTHGGQTPGMRAWRIRLGPNGGGVFAWRQVAVRLAVAGLTLGLGTLAVWIGGRALQDIASDTAMMRVD